MMTPDERVDVQIVLEDQQREQRAEAGRRQARQDRDRVDEALVEDAEHDVDHEDREREHPPEAAHRILERLRRSLEARPTRCRAASRAPRPARGPRHRRARRRARRLNESVTDGSCPMWLTDSGPTVCRVVTTADSGTSLPPGACTYSIDSAAGSRWYCGRDLHDDLVLVVGREDLRHLARAVRRTSAPAPPGPTVRPSAAIWSRSRSTVTCGFWSCRSDVTSSMPSICAQRAPRSAARRGTAPRCRDPAA